MPTRQSGRRLREALAEHAAAQGAAVFPPLTQTPDALLISGQTEGARATRLEAQLAWTEVLQTVQLETVPDVFPVAPPIRDFAWAWRVAGSLYRLQTQLTEGGLSFADVAPVAGDHFPEADRWRQLSALEDLQVQKLSGLGRREPHAARREFAASPTLPSGINRVVLLALPDPLPLAISVLEKWGQVLPVTVAVFAPAAEAARFDGWGRPLTGIGGWDQRWLQWSDFTGKVHLAADPASEALYSATTAGRYAPDADGLIAFGLADDEVLSLLETELSRLGMATYNPEGRSRRGDRMTALVTALAALAREPSYEAVAGLARCPDFLAAAQVRFGQGFSVARFLRELDDAREYALPADLPALRASVAPEQTHLARGLTLLEEVYATLVAERFPECGVTALSGLFGHRRFNLARSDDADAAESALAWREVMTDCERARTSFPKVAKNDWWDLAVHLFRETRRAEEKAPGALELQGWLELLWEDAPHLVVAGLNDGIVPEAVVGDAFVPESLRVCLGLKTNAARFARDAYMLQALAASREQGGRLDLLFAKTSSAGEPLRPSRLLLQCKDEELSERVAFLFRPVEAHRPNLPWTRAWQLKPKRTELPTRVAVTGLRAWLACPFRFYLSHVLRMESVDPTKSELDARDFGTLCHTALEAMVREGALRNCTDESVLRDYLLTAFESAVVARFGRELTLPLVIQLESARQRLTKVAAIQARERAAGWLVERAEWAFSLDIAGLEVRGKIDRIDRHEATGAWRVLDYKTTDTAASPPQTHLRPFRANDAALPPWARVVVNGRECVWADLQLPVYLRALAGELNEPTSLSCGYVLLPKASSESALVDWPDLTGELLDAARACTDGVAAAIRSGEFWPPAEVPPDQDAFAAMFHHGAADSVSAGGLLPVTKTQPA